MSTKKKKTVKGSAKKNSAKKDTSKGFRVSYSMYWESIGAWKRDVTAIVYTTREKAQRYADQLNKGQNTKNARVIKA